MKYLATTKRTFFSFSSCSTILTAVLKFCFGFARAIPNVIFFIEYEKRKWRLNSAEKFSFRLIEFLAFAFENLVLWFIFSCLCTKLNFSKVNIGIKIFLTWSFDNLALGIFFLLVLTYLYELSFDRYLYF